MKAEKFQTGFIFFHKLFFYFFCINFVCVRLSVLRGHSVISSPTQRPMTSDFCIRISVLMMSVILFTDITEVLMEL